MIRWKKTSEHSIASTCGRFHIARLFKDGVPGYLLWDGTKLITGCTDNTEARKAEAEKLAREKK